MVGTQPLTLGDAIARPLLSPAILNAVLGKCIDPKCMCLHFNIFPAEDQPVVWIPGDIDASDQDEDAEDEGDDASEITENKKSGNKDKKTKAKTKTTEVAATRKSSRLQNTTGIAYPQ